MQISEGVAYRTAVNIIFQYLHNGYHQNPLFGFNFMTKKNSRIFEQWVLTQLVTSIVVDDEYYVFLAEKGPCYQDDQTPCEREFIFLLKNRDFEFPCLFYW